MIGVDSSSSKVTQGKNQGQTTTHKTLKGRGGIGLNCLSINPKRAQMGSLLVLDCTLYILEYMWAAQGYL